MLRLLIADGACFANLLLKREGRRVLVSASVSLLFLGFVADLFGQVFANSPQLHDVGGGVSGLRALLGSLLVPGLLVSLWFGFGGGPRQLFELPHLEMLLQAPRRATTVLMATWLRYGTLVSLWCSVLCAPAAARIGDALGLRIGWAPAVVACAVLALPAIAVILAIQVVLMRFFAGRFTRFALMAVGALGSITFSLLLIAGALAQEETVRAILAAARGQALWPILLDTPARLWTALVLGEPALSDVAGAFGMISGAGVLVAAVGPLYRTAYENARVSVEPLMRIGRGRAWPSSAVAVVFRKEIAQLVHQPGQLIGLMFSAVVIVVLAGGRFLGGAFGDDPRMTEAERQVFVMLGLWLFAQLTIAPGCLLRIIVAEGKQWPLIAGAPVRTSSFLAGKLGVTALLMSWPALVAAAVGAIRFGAAPATLGAFAIVVPAGILWTASATAFVGTIPPLMRPRTERNNLVALVGVALLMVLLQATAIPGVLAWSQVVLRTAGRGALSDLSPAASHTALILGAWVLALCFAGLALGATAFQVRRLRLPER